jgi:superfamily II DNA or RNA helicase
MTLDETKLKSLRPRQEKAIAMLRESIKAGHKRIIVQAPCAFGKTEVASHIMAGALRKDNRVIFTCPRKSLVDQTYNKLFERGIYDLGVIQAQNEHTRYDAMAQVASVQTLVRRTVIDPELFIIDEAHFRFKKLEERMTSEAWKDKLVIGLTATPWRRGMGLVWDDLVIPATTQDMLKDGHLCPFVTYVPDRDADFSKLREGLDGDYTESSAESVMSDKRIVGDITCPVASEGVHRIGSELRIHRCVYQRRRSTRDF